MNTTPKQYADISHILTAKMKRRQELAALPWEKKIEIVNRMRISMSKKKWNTNDSDT